MEEMFMNLKRVAAIFCALILCSCTNYTFKPFGKMSSEQVEDFCKSYCRRKGMQESDAKYVVLKYDLGVYNDNVFVDIVRLEKEGVYGEEALQRVYVHDTFICHLNDGLYDLNVWIDGENYSYDIQDAFDCDKLTDVNIQQIINLAEGYGLREYNPNKA